MSTLINVNQHLSIEDLCGSNHSHFLEIKSKVFLKINKSHIQSSLGSNIYFSDDVEPSTSSLYGPQLAHLQEWSPCQTSPLISSKNMLLALTDKA